MSQIVEFIGPPGVGKSTIYNAVLNRWNKQSAWAPAYRLLPQANDSKYAALNYVMLIARKLFGRALTDQKKVINKSYKFLEQHPDFVNYCWDLIDKNRRSDHLNVDNRFRSAYYLYYIFGYFQWITDVVDKRIALSDELLIHRIIQITKESDDREDIRGYVELTPKPAAVIQLDAPSNIIANRILHRDNRIIRHRNRTKDELVDLSEKEIEKFDFIANLLNKKGVDIYKIDATKSIEANAEHIEEILNSLKN